MDNLLQDINRISYQLLIEEPFYGHLFVGFVKKKITSQHKLSFVPSREFIEFIFEPEYWFAQTEKVKKGLIKHELLHLVYKHPLRAREYKMKNIFYLASDLVVNQNLQTEELPHDAFTLLFLETQGVHLETNKNLNYYYDALLKVYEKSNDCNSEQNDDAVCPINLLSKLEKRTCFSSHESWRSFDDNIEAKNGIIENNLNHLFVSINNKMTLNNSWGSVSESLRSYLDTIVIYKTQKVDWKRALKVFVTSSKKTYLKNTLSRPSRRYGTIPGTKIKRRNILCIVLDTSGSLRDRDLQEYFHEIFHIWKQNVEIIIVECDVDIQRSYAYKGKIPSFTQGRGGTSFDAPIAYNNDVIKGDAIIYFTDGMAESPKIKSRVPILWLIYNKKELTNDLDGRVVFMNT
ncbi:VWA-like domain-containing protein [Cocleimonas flava]|uniref:Putative metal-dependent peptidase n=1 Tax=Cocleimonas flava TaxID=634765 RepID=A0A4R1EXJ0_9GAMM|nr:VWA-like domain-containing protein [Cocleimonas flava]TCJ82691.1 putative metal-dependent peptidase [Cocleimonas flava]